LNRYKTSTIDIRFITEELGFQSHQESAQFILDYSGAEVFQEKDDSVFLNCNAAASIFREKAGEAYRQVDIKGQI
jgi:hypothetical protein